MFWLSPRYHENGHSQKIWFDVIIFAHRWFFRSLMDETAARQFYPKSIHCTIPFLIT